MYLVQSMKKILDLNTVQVAEDFNIILRVKIMPYRANGPSGEGRDLFTGNIE